MNARLPWIVGGLAVVALGLFVWRRGGVANAAQAVGGAAVGAVTGAATGAVLGIGDAVGVPRTSETGCQRAVREGRTWDASFACPAGTFIGSLFGSSDIAGGPDTSLRGTGAGVSGPVLPSIKDDGSDYLIGQTQYGFAI